MKKVLGCLRRADEAFSLIEDGDRIAVGVSGGKDSLLLLQALHLYRMFSKKNYTLHAVCVDLGLQPFDTGTIARFCDSLGEPFEAVPTRIGEIVFGAYGGKNPCAICAHLRRGALHKAALSHGCNKVALGHSREDALETFMLSMLYEGRLSALDPRTFLDRTGLTLIRPLILLPEKHIISVSRRLGLPVQASPCPVAGRTKRQQMKELIAHMARLVPDAEEKMLGALMRPEAYRLWDGRIRTDPEE
jgi:tRNA 2-thiocytidine biosynthesis protein TtcA